MMTDLELFFEERKAELILFTDFLSEIDRNNTFNAQIPILKSQVVIMLYNLIEGTVNKAITCIFDEVSDSNLNHEGFSAHIEKIWLKHLTLNIHDNGQHDKRIEDITKFAHAKVKIELEAFRKKNKSYFGAGSLDGKRIGEIFKKFEIELTMQEPKLQEIKINRNFLAHGEKSFTDVGKDKTVPEVINSLTKVFDYLASFIAEIINYLTNQSFKKSSPI